MKRHHSFVRRTISYVCAVSVGATQVVPQAYAAATDISDLPPILSTQAKPNIMFMLDNSGSMQNIVPDAPFDGNTTYFTCSAESGDQVLATARTVELRVTGAGVPYFRYNNTDYDWGNGAGTGPTGRNKRCFDNAATYAAALFADGGNNPQIYSGAYLDADYKGNYLNWFFGSSPTTWTANARTKPGQKRRMEIAQAAAKSVVNALDRVRVGLFTYNSGNGGRLIEVMGDLDTSKRTEMAREIDLLSASGATPLGETLADIGRYFATGNTLNQLTVHPAQTPAQTRTVTQVFPHAYSNGSGVTTPGAPIESWCQKSFAVLLTDGRPQNDQNENTNIGADLLDYDGDCSGTNAGNCGTHDRKNDQQYESAGSDYLDDIAQALFEMDLRPDLTAPAATNPPKKNNVSSYTIGFADEQVKNDPLMRDTARQGGGLFLTAGREAELVSAFERIAQDILEKDGAASAVAVANAYVSAGDNSVFATRYNSGNWSGDLIAYPLDLDTGQVNLQDPVWDSASKCTNPNTFIDPADTSLGKRGCSAQVRLNERNFATSPRFIASYSCSGSPVSCDGVQFQPDGASIGSTLSASETALLNSPSSTDATAVIDYLRGDRSGETAGTYRTRTAMLGDIINAEPVIVREPNFGYTDVGYRDFVTEKANRRKVVYQGANDGMLHAFDADDATELWAYVPRLVLGSLNELTRKGYTHKFFVDGNATAGDADFLRTDGATSTATTSEWHTILVGSLGKGGRGYYAIDITNPVPADEAAAAAKVLWEFPNETNKNDVLEGSLTIDQAMGYSFGRPLIVKTTKGWVVVVSSGYNNGTTTGGNGRGYLFVLNAKTGELIRAIKASIGGTDAVEGSATTPSGLAQITPVLENALFSGRINHLYGGDNLGNLWRFDLSSGTVADWHATKVARLVDDNGDPQPITTKPDVAKLVLGASEKRMVFVGTGRYLGNSDVATTQVQTMYGLLENLAITGSNTIISPLRDNLVEQVLTTNNTATERSFLTTNPVDLNAKKGWYVDMPASGERINTNPVLVRGVLVFTSNIPSAQTCTFGGSSWFNAFNFRTGARVAGAASDAPSSYSLGNALASRTVVVKAKDGVHGLTQKTNIQIDSRKVPVGGIGTSSRRVSWKEVVDGK